MKSRFILRFEDCFMDEEDARMWTNEKEKICMEMSTGFAISEIVMLLVHLNRDVWISFGCLCLRNKCESEIEI